TLLLRSLLTALACVAPVAGCSTESQDSGSEAETTVPGPDGLTAEMGGPVSSSVCIQTPRVSCYCTGVGCRRFCRDVIVLSGGSSGAPATGVFAGTYPGYPTVTIGSGPTFTNAGAVAVVGLESDIEAGHAQIVVRDSHDNTLYDRAGQVAD